uniref:Uncharacterized protein n=1 Tax=Clostridium botulinum TaxID=1491 RepID=A0A126JHU4_CLOBO|nr:hypothetical protein [Clostridium botulinum]
MYLIDSSDCYLISHVQILSIFYRLIVGLDIKKTSRILLYKFFFTPMPNYMY